MLSSPHWDEACGEGSLSSQQNEAYGDLQINARVALMKVDSSGTYGDSRTQKSLHAR